MLLVPTNGIPGPGPGFNGGPRLIAVGVKEGDEEGTGCGATTITGAEEGIETGVGVVGVGKEGNSVGADEGIDTGGVDGDDDCAEDGTVTGVGVDEGAKNGADEGRVGTGDSDGDAMFVG